jgi:D-glycero-D-manno-heptose 1,7-bisphosphate phosphatase
VKKTSRAASDSPSVPAVFLDRDGTINRDTNHIWRIEDLELLRGASTAIRLLNQAEFKVIVITNQSGVGRGMYAPDDVERFHAEMNRRLARLHAHIDAFYFCPHHPTEARGQYRRHCRCRKPAPGLLRKAIREHNLDVTHSWIIGDQPHDIEAGRRIGIRGIRVTRTPTADDGETAPSLLTAVRRILNTHNRVRRRVITE